MVVAMCAWGAIERRYIHAAIYVIGRAVEFCLQSDSFCVVVCYRFDKAVCQVKVNRLLV
jgi:hypothetical protein